MDLQKILNRITGPIATLIILAIVHHLPVLRGIAALAFVPLVWSAYTGGLGPALASAIIITIYTVLAYPPDYYRLGQVAASAVLIALMVGYLKRHAELSQSLNGNMKRLREAVEMIRRLKVEWEDLSDSGRYKIVDSLEDKLGNLAALVFGWHSIREEIEHTRKTLGVQELDPGDDQ